MKSVDGNVVDIHRGEIYPGTIRMEHGRIAAIERGSVRTDQFLIPGFVDAHIHIESTMLAPAEFSRAVSAHGTVATVSDPHEIANVLGVEGIDFMIRESRRGAVKVFYGAPACVPATAFESAGAVLDAGAVAGLLARPDIHYLSEVMNFPGVLQADPDLMAKIAAAKRHGKPIDGHAPGLRSPESAAYAAAGISTDHECTTLDEALEKIAAGVKILIREGSAARNYQALEPLLFSHPGSCMFCSDDSHPDTLAIGHIDQLVRRAVAAGLYPVEALRIACRNPVEHYGLPVGLLREGVHADFLVVGDLREFRVLQTYIGGELVAERGRPTAPFQVPSMLNRFAARPVAPSEFAVRTGSGKVEINIILIEDGQLVTRRETAVMIPENGQLTADITRDLLKIVVVNRYTPSPPAVAFIKNFGLRRGAIASSVAHDSHNVVAVGADDESIARAVNRIIAGQGGVCAVAEREEEFLPLPIAGLMSDQTAEETAARYAAVEAMARGLGSPLRAPLMTLSFMALLVIPELKLSDRGLFDGKRFAFEPLIV